MTTYRCFKLNLSSSVSRSRSNASRDGYFRCIMAKADIRVSSNEILSSRWLGR